MAWQKNVGKWVALACFSLCVPASADDHVESGFDIQQSCLAAERLQAGSILSQRELSDAGYCLGMVRGEMVGLEIGYATGARRGVCQPENWTNGQLQQIVLKFARDNPAKLSVPVHIFILNAFSDAFPCKPAG
jgi:hypothetical protein